MKRIIKNVLLLFSIGFLLIGCGTKEDKSADYREAIQAGLDYVAAADYERARSEFEKALTEKPEDTRAEALLAQTKHYENAMQFRSEEKIELTLEELEKILAIEGGSAGIITKSENLIKNLHPMLVAAEDDEEPENLADDPEALGAPTYTFEDFRGIYTTFKGEPYNSIMVDLIMIEENEVLFGFAYSSFNNYPVTKNIINGNELTIHYNNESKSEPDVFEVILEDDGRITTKVHTYYPVTREQTEEVGLMLPYLD